MATGDVTLEVDSTYSKGTWTNLKKLLYDSQIRTEINQMIGDAINPYVPSNTGALQESMRVYEDRITWGENLEYARYQYNGEVYGPNIPITKNGMIIGWFSRPGVRYNTGRELGVPGEWKGWRFGYTTPGTMHHWLNVYQRQLKSTTNRSITTFLKRECKARGLDT